MAKGGKRHWTEFARPILQAGFVVYVLVAALLHNTSEVETPSLHTLCPFGAVETAWTLLTTGKFISKIHQSSVILGLGLLVSALMVGGAFCGWICPLGALHDFTSWVRRKLRIVEVQVPPTVDRILRYGRFVVLILIVYMSASTLKLWFGNYDPYHLLFGLGFIFEFNLAEQGIGYLITLGVIVGSLFIPRLWCRYLCPLGGLLSLIQRISPIKIRRNAEVCIDCKRCDRICPTKLEISTRQAITHDCVMCMRCANTCPAPGALDSALSGFERAKAQ